MKINFLTYSITDVENDITYYITLKYSKEYNKLVPTNISFDYKNDLETFETVDDLISEYSSIDEKLAEQIDKMLDELWNMKIDPNKLDILFKGNK